MPKPKFDPSQPFEPAKPKFDPSGEFTPVPESKPNPFQTSTVQEDKQPDLLQRFIHGTPQEKAKNDKALSDAQSSFKSKNPDFQGDKDVPDLSQYASPVSGVGSLISGAAGTAGKALGSVAEFIPGVGKVVKMARLVGKLAGAGTPEVEGAASAVEAAPKASSLAQSLESTAAKPKFDPFTKRPLSDAVAPVKTPPKIDPFSKIQKRSDTPQE